MERQSQLSDMVVRVMLMHSTLRSQVAMSLSVFTKAAKSWAKAEAQGFKVYTAAEAAKKADIIMILINDELQASICTRSDIEPNLEARQYAYVRSWISTFISDVSFRRRMLT